MSKSRMRFVRSLYQDRVRARLGLYVVEGGKMVRDYLEAGHPIEQLYGVESWWATLPDSIRERAGVVLVSQAELEALSALSAPQGALAVVPQAERELDPGKLCDGLSLGLDGVRDPGNLGSLLRVAAWFGVPSVICSPDCVDPYNPKVVQATMGALLHVEVHGASLPPLLDAMARRGAAVYGAVLDGESIYGADLGARGIILLGNEARGLSPDVRRFVEHPITIPAWTAASPGKDSLNVAVAAAVVCSEFRRRERPQWDARRLRA